MCGQGGGVDYKHPFKDNNIRHPPTRQLVANYVLASVFKPLGGIALLTLVQVAIRVTDGSKKLNVLLTYILRIRSKLHIPCKSPAKAFTYELLLLIKLFNFPRWFGISFW